ncbi:MAG: pseudouridine synthase [Chitinophagaceae bacterium]|nr:pseudouridine synthase [Chitinophagaceae bacterium]
MFHYYLFYKPFQVLSAFTSDDGKKTLADCIRVPRDVYPVGRLDYDSEGLLLLTNDRSLNQQLLHPAFHHPRTYLVQVEGKITEQAVQQLSTGVSIRVGTEKYTTRPTTVQIINPAPELPERNPPIRFRKNVPDTWISITLTEGKNRQVRKMTAGVGFPTLRLIRIAIGSLSLGNLKPGQLLEISGNTIRRQLFPFQE